MQNIYYRTCGFIWAALVTWFCNEAKTLVSISIFIFVGPVQFEGFGITISAAKTGSSSSNAYNSKLNWKLLLKCKKNFLDLF